MSLAAATFRLTNDWSSSDRASSDVAGHAETELTRLRYICETVARLIGRTCVLCVTAAMRGPRDWFGPNNCSAASLHARTIQRLIAATRSNYDVKLIHTHSVSCRVVSSHLGVFLSLSPFPFLLLPLSVCLSVASVACQIRLLRLSPAPLDVHLLWTSSSVPAFVTPLFDTLWTSAIILVTSILLFASRWQMSRLRTKDWKW